MCVYMHMLRFRMTLLLIQFCSTNSSRASALNFCFLLGSSDFQHLHKYPGVAIQNRKKREYLKCQIQVKDPDKFGAWQPNTLEGVGGVCGLMVIMI